LTWVLDASIAVKWFVPDGDANDAVAERVLRDLSSHPSRYIVPELFIHEMLAVLCKRFKQVSDAQRAMDRLTRLGLRRMRADERIMRTAIRLAYQYKLSGYDATYAALAVELPATWLTLDAEAHRRAAAAGISEIAS
jgi:predicted nucleic acid-binding protein